MSNGDHPEPQATANSGAVAVVGLDLRGEEPAPKKQIYSWALWDWATQPFHSVILTFIFTALYLTSDAFLPAGLASLADKDPAKVAGIAELTSGLGLGGTIAGFAIL
ncbi:MAG: MFS transporter, partial [Microbacterium sp. 14-71-5]